MLTYLALLTLTMAQLPGEDPPPPEPAANQRKDPLLDPAVIEAMREITEDGNRRSDWRPQAWGCCGSILLAALSFQLLAVGLGMEPIRFRSVLFEFIRSIAVLLVGMLGFGAIGLALMFGGHGADTVSLGPFFEDGEYSVTLCGKEFGIAGKPAAFFGWRHYDKNDVVPGLMTGVHEFFLFQSAFIATLLVALGATLSRRCRLPALLAVAFLVGAAIYPILGNWFWGNGWLAALGRNFGLGHGGIDFAGSALVYLTAGMAIVAAALAGPRPEGVSAEPGAAKSVAALAGVAILAFAGVYFAVAGFWIESLSGAALTGMDQRTWTVLVNSWVSPTAGLAGAALAGFVLERRLAIGNIVAGMLAGFVAIHASAYFITPASATVIGAIAGVLATFMERWLRRSADSFPAIAGSALVAGGAWGLVAVGLFADGKTGAGWNDSSWYRYEDQWFWFAEPVSFDKPPEALRSFADFDPAKWQAVGVTGYFHGATGQLAAQCIGLTACLLWLGGTFGALFTILRWCGGFKHHSALPDFAQTATP